jgi:hypothetical protein
VSGELLAALKHIVFEEDLDFTTIQLRFKQYRGIVTLDPTEGEFPFRLQLYEAMTQLSSPFHEEKLLV